MHSVFLMDNDNYIIIIITIYLYRAPQALYIDKKKLKIALKNKI